MPFSEIALRRFHNQRLLGSTLKTPREVVAWHGAMQAQEYAYVKWGLAQRMPGESVDADMDRAYNAGEMLRTHVMRPTWHFVAPEDLRWLLELTAPRVNLGSQYRLRQLELDEAQLVRGCEIIARTLEGGNHLTRKELAAALEQNGLSTDGQRIAYIVMRAELDALICSGPLHGKQFTYALLEERVPSARKLARDEALAELTRRYFTSHGPATVHDFSWWSGLTIADIRDGIEMVRSELVEISIDDTLFWSGADMPSVSAPDSPDVRLLPPYDEFAVGYKNYSGNFDPILIAKNQNLVIGGMTVIDGTVRGVWKRVVNRGAVTINSTPFREFSHTENEAFHAAAARFGEFVGMPVAITVGSMTD